MDDDSDVSEKPRKKKRKTKEPAKEGSELLSCSLEACLEGLITPSKYRRSLLVWVEASRLAA